MANKKIYFGILVMVLVFGMMVIGCDNDNNNNSNGNGNGNGLNGESGKKLIITGIGISGNVSVFLDAGIENGGAVAWGNSSGVVSGSNVTFNLKKLDMTNMSAPLSNDSWNGNGYFFVSLYNKTTQEILSSGNLSPDYLSSSTSFSNETTSINWNQFILQ